tara:strand:- start:4220 stop:5188 length:969 start_codon:yes stop_codon:yes gene_type:complete
MNNIINYFLEINLSEKHKKLTNDQKTFFLGGFLFLIGILFTGIIVELKIFCFIIYLIGIFSDKKYLSSPNLRLLLQTLLILFTIYILEIRVYETRLYLLDNILKFKIISIIFTAFCILILINGSNFIDGINCNLILYYLIITCIVIFLNNENFYILIKKKDLIIIAVSLCIILILNFLGKITSGDSGAYLISFIWGINLINISSNDNFVSPFFIVLLLWYPAFENLFSIVRKLRLNKSALEADFNHIHQILFLFINTKIKNKKIANNFSGILINSYNILIFLCAINYYNETKIMVLLILTNLVVYFISYFMILFFLKASFKK